MHTGCWRFRPGLLMAALMVVFALSLAVASGAQAYIYWVNDSTGSIGRANLDGSGVNQNFIPQAGAHSGVAVDPGRYDSAYRLVANDTHIYWINGWAIGRANLDGSDKNVTFLQAQVQQPMYVTAYNMRAIGDSNPRSEFHRAVNLVWTEAPWQGNTFTGELVGSALLCEGPYCVNPDEDWIHPASANYIAAGATDSEADVYDSGYVYWTGGMEDLIGRANLKFATAACPTCTPTVNERFITTTTTKFYSTTEGLAVRQENFCTTCGYIYWVNRSVANVGGWIGRAKLDGTGVMPDFINLLTGSSADTPQALAVDPPKYDSSGQLTPGGHIYWTMPNSGRIGRANLDGTGANLAFITGAAKPWGIAVDAGGPPPGVPQLTKVTQSATSWRLGTRLPRTARARRPVGTTFAFTLDRSARVRFLFTRRTVGRRVGGRCVAQTRANRSRPRCLRTARAAFTRQARAGRTRLRFQGRITRTRKLAPGRYRLILTATAKGRRSKPAILRFTILP